MDKYSYDKINEFCDNYKETVSQSHRDFMIRKFAVSYYSTIEEKKQTNGNLTKSDMDSIRDALLNKINLENSLIAAQNYYNLVEERNYQTFKKKVDKLNFWKSVWASILASLLYSISLLILFWVAKDQISTWLSSLAKRK